MRFVIPVVFYALTNVVCVYSSNTIIFIGIFYIRYNYMFRRLVMAIFRLYMKYLFLPDLVPTLLPPYPI